MTPGMIFNKYALWLLKYKDPLKHDTSIDEESTWKKLLIGTWYNIIHTLRKPLGLCPYCNGTWIAVVVFVYFFKLNLTIFLFIGIVWFFIRLLEMLFNKNI
jgi:hypothetical protein